MATTDKRVDAYIAKAAPFAQPILRELRAIVHEGCPEVVETIKWGFPNFDYKGILCNMAAFKQHCSFGFWKSSLVIDEQDSKSAEAHGQMGRLTSVKDLPRRKILLSYVRKAAKFNGEGAKVERSKKAPRKELAVPRYFAAALKKNKKAFRVFEGFSPSKRRDYVEWITEAKTDTTRDRRVQASVEWIAEGKARNWKYESC
ncbi:MAG TPA: YdeI/OmpD-associated family protein [Terriglobales bacterium]|nr:YdeI/OmpD-associated family protein [Terriglobales bacterium]